MAEGPREEQYIIAFKNGNKVMAEQLLPSIPQPATITTTFKSRLYLLELSLVSLLHLAAYWGWRNVVTSLVSVYNCAANCKDEYGHIPLHYAASNGHLEVVKYFIVELHCDPRTRTSMAGHHFTMLVLMVTSTLLSISSERNTVTHHVRPIMALHHFTMLVTMATPTLYNICY